MKIGIDIDDTLVDTTESLIEVKNKYNLKFNKSLNDDLTEEERIFIFENYLDEILKGAKIKKDAIKVLKKLNDLGHELVVITARTNDKYNPDIEEYTRDFIKKNGINISDYYFHQYLKSDIAKKLNLDLMIDDNKYIYQNMKNSNIDCILFGDKIKGWNEVLEYIISKEDTNGR